MALKNLMPRWLQRLVGKGANAGAMHDALESTFIEVAADKSAMDADTVIATASTDGLARWGFDLLEQRVSGQTDAQYAGMLQTIKQGQAVNQDGLTYALGFWGLSFVLVDAGDAQGFGDWGFGDWSYEVNVSASPQMLVAFADPWPGSTPTPTQYATARQALLNALSYAQRVKARGVQLVAWIPNSLK